MKKLMAVVSILVLTVLAGCETDADVASYNLSKEADMFRIQRRVVFYNGITDSYMLTIEGRCSLGNNDSAGQLTVTCKVAEGQFKKHFLGLSDNVTYFVEQLDPVPVSVYRYKVIFKPSIIVPDVELSR